MQFFDSEADLDQHDLWKHRYCVSCKRFFNSKHALDTHLRCSSIHNERTHVCPGRNCSKAFISYADLTLHLESGACRSGIGRRRVNALAVKYDRNNVITNPNRLIAGPDGVALAPHIVHAYATERSFNGVAYECILCHRTFTALDRLNAHLGSPTHDDKIYRCPVRYDGCGMEFKTLSGLMQHSESGTCEVRRFQTRVNSALDNLTARMGRIGFR